MSEGGGDLPSVTAGLPPDVLPLGAEASEQRDVAIAAASAAMPSRRVRGPHQRAPSAKVEEWLRRVHHNRMGDKLRALRKEHTDLGLPLESYTLAHAALLGTFHHPFDTSSEAREYCKDIHRGLVGCACTTCHWCRQKTTSKKTKCSKCHDNRDNRYGGPRAGVICGSCLWVRFGENVHEAILDTNWECPACREICNCSANNCVRGSHGWLPTRELNSEAKRLGYASVAHYLVLSQLDESLWVNITNNIQSLQPMIERENQRRVDEAKQRKEVLSKELQLKNAVRPVVERRLDELRAVSVHDADAVDRKNRQLLSELGFGRLDALLEDLQEEGSSAKPSRGMPGNAQPGGPSLRGGDSWPNTAVAGAFAASRQQEIWQQRSPGSTLRLLRPPRQHPDSTAGRSVAIDSRVRHPAWEHAHGLGAGNAVGLPGATSGSFGSCGANPQLAHGAGCSASAAAHSLLNAAASSGAAAASGAHDGDAERRHQLDGLLAPVEGGEYPENAEAPTGQGLAPHLAAGHRPAHGVQAARRQAAVSAGSRQPLAPRHLQHQSRLTPLTAQSEKKQEQHAAGPGAAALPADSMQQERVADPDSFQQGNQSPLGMAAEPSQQLGLSPGRSADGPGPQPWVAVGAAAREARGIDAASEQQAAAAALPAMTAVPESDAALDAAVAPAIVQGSERQRPFFSGWAEEWGQLLRSAQGLVEEAWQVDPYGPSFLSGPEPGRDAEEVYEETHRATVEALRDILAEANSCLMDTMAVGGRDSAGYKLVPLDSLKPMLGLYNLLASTLPLEDVQFRVVPRMLGHECFVDFEHSVPSARLAILEGWAELLITLDGRALSVDDVARRISSSVTTLAREAHQLSALLKEVEAVRDNPMALLPQDDRHIGTYCYDSAERRKSVDSIYTELETHYQVLVDVLHRCLQHCVSTASVLRHRAAWLLPRALALALLSHSRSLPVNVRRQALGLLFQVMVYSSANQENHGLLSPDELNKLRHQRQELCETVNVLLPFLEDIVAENLNQAAALASDAPYSPADKNMIFQERVSTLAEAYRFMLQCKQSTWQMVEEHIVQLNPFCKSRAIHTARSLFWQTSSYKLRRVSVALMAHSLQGAASVSGTNGPVLMSLPGGILKHWLFSLLDSGSSFSQAEELTAVLAEYEQTKPLFADQLWRGKLSADSSGQETAKLLSGVFGRMCYDTMWHETLRSLLEGIDEVLERRLAEDCTSREQVPYSARLARILAAVLLAAAPVVKITPPLGVRQSASSRASSVSPPRQLVQRLAQLAVGSCLDVHAELREQAICAARSWTSSPPAIDSEAENMWKGALRRRLKELAFGQLSALWGILHALGGPAAFGDVSLFRPLWTVVSSSLELCSGNSQASTFDQLVVEILADSLVQHGEGAASAPLSQLLQCTLCTILWRYLDRTDQQRRLGSGRTQVNAVRFLEVLLCSLKSPHAVQQALLCMLRCLLNALWPAPSPTVRVLLYRMLARLLHSSSTSSAELVLPSYSLLQQLTPQQQREQLKQLGAAKQPLHIFWQVAAADALLCCQEAALSSVPASRQQQVHDAIRGMQDPLKVQRLRAPKPRLLVPLEKETAEAAINDLYCQANSLAREWEAASASLDALRHEHDRAVGDALREEAKLGDGRPALAEPTSLTVAEAAMDLLRSFLAAGCAAASTATAGTAGTSPAAGPLAPARAAPAESTAGPIDWEALSPGFQWTLVSLPALATLVLHSQRAGGRLGGLVEGYKSVQQAVMDVSSSLVLVKLKPPQPRKRAADAAQDAAGPGAEPASRITRTAHAGSVADARQQQPAARVEPAASMVQAAAAPDAASVQQQQQGALSTGVLQTPRWQQQPLIKVEPQSQLAGPAPPQLPEEPPAQQREKPAPGPSSSGRGLDTSFADVRGISKGKHFNVVGALAAEPQFKGEGGTQALKLDLRDHRQQRLTVLVQRRLHGTLLDHLAAEAEERWGRSRSRPVLRVRGVQVVSTGASVLIMSEVGSVEWDPAGERAAKIAQLQASGSLSVQPPAAHPGVSNQQLHSAATPAMHWSQQQRQQQQSQQAGMFVASRAASPCGTQVADAGMAGSSWQVALQASQWQVPRSQATCEPAARAAAAESAAPQQRQQEQQESQAPPPLAEQQQQHGWQSLPPALQAQQHQQHARSTALAAVAQSAVQLLKARGVPQNAAVTGVKKLLMGGASADKAAWVVRGAAQLADAVQMAL